MKPGRFFAALLCALLPAAAAVTDADLIVEAELQAPSAYVQSQAVYVLRLLQAVAVSDLRAVPPRPRLAELRPLGEVEVRELRRGGQRYRSSEWRYAVFPFASGDLLLAGAYVEARRPVAGGAKTLRLEAPKVTLQVRPAAVAADRPWLPARRLMLEETWQPEAAAVAVGDILQRTLRITAEGLDAAQLPAPAFAAEGLAIVAEAPRLNTRIRGTTVIGSREQTFRVRPLRPGVIEIPALGLDWWDLATDRPAATRLLARHLTVAAGKADASPPPAAERAKPAASGAIPGIGPAAGAALLLAGFALWSWRRRQRPLAIALRRLNHARRSGDPAATRSAILAWSSQRWPEAPPPNLEALAIRLASPQATATLADLDQHCYGPKSGADWNPADFGKTVLPAVEKMSR